MAAMRPLSKMHRRSRPMHAIMIRMTDRLFYLLSQHQGDTSCSQTGLVYVDFSAPAGITAITLARSMESTQERV